MVKFFLEDGSYFTVKENSIHITTKNENNVIINPSNNPVNKESRIFLENGDNISIQLNSIFIDVTTTKVYVNEKLVYYMFPYYLSDSFCEFCTVADKIYKETYEDKEWVIADFNLSGIEFKAISPTSSEGYYRFIFKNILPPLSQSISDNVLLLRKLKISNFIVEMGDEKNILVLKTKRFTYNDIFQAIYSVSSYFTDINNGNNNSENYTA